MGTTVASQTVRAGQNVKRGQSKISFGTSRFGAIAFLNFDLTPFYLATFYLSAFY